MGKHEDQDSGGIGCWNREETKYGPCSASVACFTMGNESVIVKLFLEKLVIFSTIIAFTATSRGLFQIFGLNALS